MRKIVLSIFAVLTFCLGAWAQNQLVTGIVSDWGGAPVVGATVSVVGTSVATTTNGNGEYSISVAPNATLEISYVGMTTQTVAIAGRTNVDVTLEEDATQIEHIIVTAMGITKSEKSLGYSATTVQSDQLTASRNSSAVQSLAGKVAGVQISGSSTNAGAATSVVIRGVSSIGGSNQPLYVIDGVPLQNTTMSVNQSGYGLMGVGVNSINPDDIETMTVLKGAAATALYGSRATGGVILINTKNGRESKGSTEITVNSGVQFTQVSYLPEFQNTFGTGWDGGWTKDENGSWGPRLNDQLRVYGPIINNSQMIKNYTAIPNNIINFFETGVQYTNSISMTGGNANTSYYLSYSNVNDDGIMPSKKDTYKKNTLSFRGSHKAYEWLSLDSSVNISTQTLDAIQTSQGQSVMEGLFQSARDISFIDMKDLTSIFNQPEGYYTPYGITNPYWLIENTYNRASTKKVFGKIQVNIMPTKYLTFNYRFGFDYLDADRKITIPQIAMDPSYANAGSTNQEGSITAAYNRIFELNHDFLANYTNKVGNFDLNVTAGANINERGSTGLSATVTGLTFDTGFWDLSNTTNMPAAGETQSLRRSVSAFADAQIGWDDQVYVNVTARNDWSSTLPKDGNSFFYPGATLSWIFTNSLDLPDVISFGKLRAAYGQTGRDPNAYLTIPVFAQGYSFAYLGTDMSFPFNGYNAYQAARSLAAPTLQPEITTELEFGGNFQLFDNRIGIDIAYYDRLSDMQIFSLPSDPATGYTSMVVNFGKVRNKGIELLLTTTPVKTRNFRWDVDFNFAKNNNVVESLPAGLEGGRSLITGYDGVRMYAEEGQPIGTLWTTLAKHTEDGQVIVNKDGLPVQGTDYEATGLTVQPDWTGGITTSLTYKNFSISASLDVRVGGKMYSRTRSLLQFTGNSVETTYNDRNAFVVPNSVQEGKDADGKIIYTENSTPITLYSSSFQYYFNGNNSYPIDGGLCKLVDRSYAKLRDLTISYDIPAAITSKLHLKGLRVSFVGNNLFMWTAATNSFIDPDQGYSTDLQGMFGEITPNAPCRYLGFNVQVKF